jgi:hypothetical protein
VCGSTTIPASFPTVGRNIATINPHNSSYDVRDPNNTTAGIGWGFGSGVSAFHVFYASGHPTDGDNRFFLYVDPQSGTNKWPLVENVQRDKRYDFCLHVILGRTDQELGLAGPGVPGGGIGDHPNNGAGRIRMYVDGTLTADTGNINTLHRAQSPADGKFYTQTLLYRPWDGGYVVPSLSQQITLERTLSRVGTTLEQALSDDGFTLVQEWENGSTADLAPLSSTDFRSP